VSENTMPTKAASHSHTVVLLGQRRPTPSIYWAFLGFLQLPAAVIDRDEKNLLFSHTLSKASEVKRHLNTHKDVCPRRRQIRDKVFIRSGVKHP